MHEYSILEELIKREGGYVDHPADRGGPTKYGITLKTYRRLDPDATEVELKALDVESAIEIYEQLYIRPYGLTSTFIPYKRIQEFLIDYAVHSGPKHAVKALQKLIGTTPDGVVGPRTSAKLRDYVAQYGETTTLVRLVKERVLYLGRVIAKRSANAVFAAGWMNRVMEFCDV